jgi:hypothetical protein
MKDLVFKMKNNILILSRLNNSIQVELLKYKFGDNFFVKIFSQEDINNLNEKDLKVLSRYKNICSPHIPEVNAWSYALNYAITNSKIQVDQRWWFIEDDVAITAEGNLILEKLFNDFSDVDLLAIYCESKTTMLDWPDWQRAENILEDNDLFFSYNCLSMLSSNLILKIDDFITSNGLCLFHEILFHSIAAIHKLKIQDINLTVYKDYFQNFRYRPEVESGIGFLHPVKNEINYQLLSAIK